MLAPFGGQRDSSSDDDKTGQQQDKEQRFVFSKGGNLNLVCDSLDLK